MAERRLTKIKVKRKETISEVTIVYEVFNDKANDGWMEVTYPSKEEPRQELEEALDQFLPLLIDAVGLDENWQEGQIIGVMIKYLDGQVGVNIVGKREINKRAACPPSPFIVLEDGLESSLIKPLEQEAFKYLDGDRKQQSLF